MKFKFDLKREKVIIFVLVTLLVLSLSYVAFDFALKVRNRVVFQGYKQAISEIITEAEKESCEPIRIYFEEKEVYIVNAECLEEDTIEEKIE
jgi:hypothetical protein